MATNEEAFHAFKVLTKWLHKQRRKANVLILVLLGGWNGFNSWLGGTVVVNEETAEEMPEVVNILERMESRLTHLEGNGENLGHEISWLKTDVKHLKEHFNH